MRNLQVCLPAAAMRANTGMHIGLWLGFALQVIVLATRIALPIPTGGCASICVRRRRGECALRENSSGRPFVDAHESRDGAAPRHRLLLSFHWAFPLLRSRTLLLLKYSATWIAIALMARSASNTSIQSTRNSVFSGDEQNHTARVPPSPEAASAEGADSSAVAGGKQMWRKRERKSIEFQ